MNPASLLSAVSATIAAILVAVNLYVSGRRERNRWARDVLVDVFVIFLTAGFEGSGACNRLLESRRLNRESEILAYRESIKVAHRTETEMLTKMRLLTSPAVVEAAMRLHVATHANVDFAEGRLPGSSHEEQDAVNDRVWQARRSFLAAAKTEIGLKPMVSIITHQVREERARPA
jgi:hypothetical protein